MGEKITGVLIQHKQLVLQLFLRIILSLLLGFFDLDLVLGSQIAQRLGITESLVLPQEFDRVTSTTATEALEQVLGRRYGERRRFLRMKGTQTQEVGAPFPEGDKIRYNILDLGSIQDSLDRTLGNHYLKVQRKHGSPFVGRPL